MNLKKRIWDFFKQKEDIVDHIAISKINANISDLDSKVFNLKQEVAILEQKLEENSKLLDEIETIKTRIENMDKVYAHKIYKLETEK